MSQPLPKIDSVSAPFWAGLTEGRLLVQWCDDCNRSIHYPRIHCPHCLGKSLRWKESSGRGTVQAYTIVHTHPDPFFKSKVPYAVALIEIEDGVTLMSNLVDVEMSSEAICVGMPVKARFQRVAESIGLHEFIPLKGIAE